MTRTRKPVTLPTKASDLLELAVKDARAVAKRKGYRLQMGVWHQVTEGSCRVCMAGAVVANTLHVPHTETKWLRDFDQDTARAMSAINELRCGYWVTFVSPAKARPALRLIRADFSYFRDGGRAKWSTYLKAAKMLRAVGL